MSSEEATGGIDRGTSSGGGHPPLARLLTYYHRTLSDDDRTPLEIHLERCPHCRRVLQRIEATVTQFHGAKAWRDACPSTETLFFHAIHHLPDARAREVQDHITTCFQCREELLVFRDLRQSARVGRSAFLNPGAFALLLHYWRSRGVWAWLLQPRWATQVKRAALALGSLVLAFALYRGVVAGLSQQGAASNRSRIEIDDALFRKPEVSPTPSPGPMKEEFKLRQTSQTLYFYVYDATGIKLLSAGEGGARWADFVIRNDDAEPGAFRIGLPPGESGMIVLRPLEELLPDEQARLGEQLEQVLTPAVRASAQAWSTARARIQQVTGGAVWLLQPPPKGFDASRYAGPAPGESGTRGFSPASGGVVSPRESGPTVPGDRQGAGVSR